jgi:hypothetical protein
MSSSRLLLVLSILILQLFTPAQVFSALVSGASIRYLEKSVTPQIREEVTSEAVDSLRYELTHWLNENMNTPPDLKNRVTRHFLELFADSCAAQAVKNSYVEGREFTVRFKIEEKTIREVVADHNARFDAMATKLWSLAQEGIKFNRQSVIFNGCIQTLFYTRAHIGLIGQDEDPQRQQVAMEAQQRLTAMVERMRLLTEQPILTGKPGNPVDKLLSARVLLLEESAPPVAEATDSATTDSGSVPVAPAAGAVDTIGLPGIALTGMLPDGTVLFTANTGPDGRVMVEQFTMPFVAHGTFLHVAPDFGAAIRPDLHFEAGDFGLTLPPALDQTIIFNVVRPVYTLEYRASAANNVEIPPDFASSASVGRFLKDSLHMIQNNSSANPDFSIKLLCQVSQYRFDETEETRMKTEVQATVHQLKEGKKTIERALVLHEETYESGVAIPKGLFFWESTTKLRTLIRDMLREL